MLTRLPSVSKNETYWPTPGMSNGSPSTLPPASVTCLIAAQFAHLQTAAPGTDPVPKRGADGKLIVTESTGLVFVLLPGGAFRMGAAKPDENQALTEPNVDAEATAGESPVTEVKLEPFFASKYEMTQGQWMRLVGNEPERVRARAELRRQGDRSPASGRAGELGRRRRVAAEAGARAPDRGAVGVRGEGRDDDAALDRRRDRRPRGRRESRGCVLPRKRRPRELELRAVERRLRGPRSGRLLRPESVRPPRRARQRLGVVPRSARGLRRPRAAGRRTPQPRGASTPT